MTSAAPSVGYLPEDPLLPSRDWLLDDTASAEVFSTTLGATGALSIDRVERRRVKYRIGESLRCVHRIWSGDRSWLVSSRMRASGAAGLWAAAMRRAQPCPPLHGVSWSEALQTVFWSFPNDRCLEDVGALSGGLPAIRNAYASRAVAVDIVGYNPERAVIARITDQERSALGYAKLYVDEGFDSARGVLEWLEHAIRTTRSPLRVPRLRGEEPARYVLVTDAVSGVHLEQLTGDQLDSAFRGLGVALGHLHSLPLPTSHVALPLWDAFDEAALSRAADIVGWAQPILLDISLRTADLLLQNPPPETAPVGLHGDVNSRNWLVTPESVGLIDLDQASRGPAAADLAAVLAWLRARTIAGTWRLERERDLTAAFRHGYAEIRALPSEAALTWHRGAALLVERALRAITRVRPDTLRSLDALMTAAHTDALEASRA